MAGESANAFLLDVRKRIDYFRAEHQLSYSEAIGVLCLLRYELEKEAFDAAASDDEQDG